jgi:RNA polymerase II subunit A-like phosphatase
MKILSPPGLAYPIIVKELKRQRDDEVRRSDPLFEYLYDTWVEEGDRVTGEVKQVEKRWRMIFQASVDGTINKWYIKLGDVIKGPGYVVAPHTLTSC